MRMTEYAVLLPTDGESAVQIMKTDKVVEEWRAGDSLDKILAAAETIARKEWGEGPMLYLARMEDPDIEFVGYQFYVED